MLVDSHCHLDFPQLWSQRSEVLERAAQVGVMQMVNVAVSSIKARQYPEQFAPYPQLYFTFGTHPDHVLENPFDEDSLNCKGVLEHPKCVAIGETGLDFSEKTAAPRDVQERAFRNHIALARVYGLPIVVHTRAAEEETMAVIESELSRGMFQGILHCFTGSQRLAEFAIEHGFWLSFSGILTFKNAQNLRTLITKLPHERLLVETDAPYLAPVPHRGKVNEPSMLIHTAQILAQTLSLPLPDVYRITRCNTLRVMPKLQTQPTLIA